MVVLVKVQIHRLMESNRLEIDTPKFSQFLNSYKAIRWMPVSIYMPSIPHTYLYIELRNSKFHMYLNPRRCPDSTGFVYTICRFTWRLTSSRLLLRPYLIIIRCSSERPQAMTDRQQHLRAKSPDFPIPIHSFRPSW